jgi:hypothetical protein
VCPVAFGLDVRSSAQELKGRTDKFRVKFYRGLLLGEGFAGLGLTALIAENEENLRPEGPTSAGSSLVLAEAAAELHTLPERSTFSVVGASRGLST